MSPDLHLAFASTPCAQACLLNVFGCRRPHKGEQYRKFPLGVFGARLRVWFMVLQDNRCPLVVGSESNDASPGTGRQLGVRPSSDCDLPSARTQSESADSVRFGGGGGCSDCERALEGRTPSVSLLPLRCPQTWSPSQSRTRSRTQSRTQSRNTEQMRFRQAQLHQDTAAGWDAAPRRTDASFKLE